MTGCGSFLFGAEAICACCCRVTAQRGLRPGFLSWFKASVLVGLVFSVILCAALGIGVLETGYSHWHRACVLVAV